MSDSAQPPRKTSDSFIPGECHEHHQGCNDHGEEVHVHVHLCRPYSPPAPQESKEYKEDFSGVPTTLISAGQGSIKTSTMTITQISGQAQCGVSAYREVDKMLSGVALALCIGMDEVIPPQLVRLDFAFACARLKFAMTYQHRPVTFWFYDKRGKLQGTREVPPSEGPHKWVEFEAPPGGEVSRMDISVSDYLFLDFFTFVGRPVAQVPCCDPPEQVHVHVHLHHKCCPPVPVELRKIRFGFTEYAIGSPSYPNLLAQINAPENYGPNGTYNKIQSVDVSDASVDIKSPSLTAEQLKSKYDVLSVGLHVSEFTVEQSARLKKYATLGGVIILACDISASVGLINVLQVFGHTGSFVEGVSGGYSGISSATEILANYFGDSSGVTLAGSASKNITSAQLPAGSKVLATSGANVLFWTVGGTEGRVVAMSDVELTMCGVSGTKVEAGQEKFLNNMMSYVFDQALKTPLNIIP